MSEKRYHLWARVEVENQETGSFKDIGEPVKLATAETLDELVALAEQFREQGNSDDLAPFVSAEDDTEDTTESED